MPLRDSAHIGAPCWIDLYTSDPDRAEEFYGRLFGWKAESAGEEFGGYITFSKDDRPVAGGMKNDGQGGMPDAWSVYLATEDAAATTAAATANGGQIIVPPMVVGELGTMAVVTDAGGAAIGVWQPGLHKGFGIVAEPGTPSWFELHTRDYDASVEFYKTVFAWDAHVVSDVPEFRYTTYGEGDGQEAGIMDASGFLPEGVPANWQIYFAVEDADTTAREIVELGGSVVTPPEDTPYGRIAAVADPTGTLFKLRAGA